MACPSEYEIWTFGHDECVKLYSHKGELLQSIKTKYIPVALAVTNGNDLVYADDYGYVNKVEGNDIKELMRLEGWKAIDVCSTCTSFGDLMKKNPSKVVRYCGSTEKQTTQFDDDGQLLYSSGKEQFHAENKKFDIICLCR